MRFSLNLSPNDFADMCSSSHSHLGKLVSVNHLTLLWQGIHISGDHQEVLDGSASFGMCLYPFISCLLQIFLTLSLRSFVYSTTMRVFSFFGCSSFSLIFVLFESFFWVLPFIFILFSAHPTEGLGGPQIKVCNLHIYKGKN